MRLMLLLLLLAAPGMASAQTFAGGCRAEGDDLVCTARLPGQPGQRISAWGRFSGNTTMLGEAVGSISDCQGSPRALGRLPWLANQGSRMLFLTEVQKAGAHCLRVVISHCTLSGAARPCMEVFNGLGFEARLR